MPAPPFPPTVSPSSSPADEGSEECGVRQDAERCAKELQTATVDGLKIDCGIFGEQSGHFWPAKVVHAIAAGATDTTFCVGTNALGMDPAEGEGVVVRTDRGDVKCKRVAICTNGWSPRLLPELSEVLYPVRNGVIMTAPVKAWSWPGSVSIGDGPEEIYAQKRPVRRPSASDPCVPLTWAAG